MGIDGRSGAAVGLWDGLRVLLEEGFALREGNVFAVVQVAQRGMLV